MQLTATMFVDMCMNAGLDGSVGEIAGMFKPDAMAESDAVWRVAYQKRQVHHQFEGWEIRRLDEIIQWAKESTQ